MSERATALRQALMHPVDEIAQEYLQSRLKDDSKIRGWLANLITEMEQQFYLQNLADNLRVTSASHPRLHAAMNEATASVDLSNVQLYLDTNSTPNAWTLGEKTPGVVITHALVDLLNDQELVFVLGHELGHLAALHTRNRLMLMQIETLRTFMSMVPFVGAAFAAAYQVALNFWYRRAELTCDRFGLIACGNSVAAMSALTKLAGGQAHLDPGAITEAMMGQAEEFREKYHQQVEGAVAWDVFDGVLAGTATRTHPWAAVRVWELSHWQQTEHFRLVAAGDLAGAVKLRRDTPSFFRSSVTPGDDPFRVLLTEATGELGKGVTDLLSAGRQFFRQKP